MILPKLKAGIWHLSALMYISITASCQKIHLCRVTAATVLIEILEIMDQESCLPEIIAPLSDSNTSPTSLTDGL
jgi:hypothetical protein